MEFGKDFTNFRLLKILKEKSEKEICNSKDWENLFKGVNLQIIIKISPRIKHQLTHQTIFAQFWHIDSKIPANKNSISIQKKDSKKLPYSKIIRKIS